LAEIRAARSVTDLIKEVIEDKIKHLEDSLIMEIDNPTKLSAHVKCIHEFKNIARLFDQTEE
jgi:hypothetical protein